MRACDSFGKNMISCIKYVAQAGATPKLLETKDGFDSLCGSLVGERRDACTVGALIKILDLNNGDDSEHACDRVTLTYHSECLKVLEFFHKDTVL